MFLFLIFSFLFVLYTFHWPQCKWRNNKRLNLCDLMFMQRIAEDQYCNQNKTFPLGVFHAHNCLTGTPGSCTSNNQLTDQCHGSCLWDNRCLKQQALSSPTLRQQTKTWLHYLHRAYLPCILNVLLLILQQQLPVLLKDSNYALVCVGHTAGLLVQCHWHTHTPIMFHVSTPFSMQINGKQTTRGENDWSKHSTLLLAQQGANPPCS